MAAAGTRCRIPGAVDGTADPAANLDAGVLPRSCCRELIADLDTARVRARPEPFDYFGLGFLQGAFLKDPKKVLVQPGQVHAGRVMKFTSAKDITAKVATIKAYVREAIAVEKAGRRLEPRKTADLPVPAELTAWLRRDPRRRYLCGRHATAAFSFSRNVTR